MRISKIEYQKNNKSKVNLYIDDEFYAGLFADAVISLGLFEGQELTRSQREKILIQNDYQNCLRKSYDLLSRRIQSEHELRVKLSKKFDFHTINKVVSKLYELNYLNDTRFCQLWIESRSKSRGKKMLSMELYKKGIDKQVIENVLALSLDYDSELEAARRLCLKKKICDLDSTELYKKIFTFLGQKGFSYDVIKKVYQEYKKSCD